MATESSPAQTFLFTLVDRIAVQWESDEIEIPAEDFGKLLRRAVHALPDSDIKKDLLAHLPVWQDDAWKRCVAG